MIHPDQFDRLVERVAKLNNLDLDTAGDVVAIAGDCREIDDKTGKVVVDLNGKTLLVNWPTDEN